jgi:hypothetical protein
MSGLCGAVLDLGGLDASLGHKMKKASACLHVSFTTIYSDLWWDGLGWGAHILLISEPPGSGGR